MENVTFNILAIHCDGGLSSIQMMLGNIGAVSDVDGNLDAKTLTVTYDPRGTTLQGIVETLKDIGFPPEG